MPGLTFINLLKPITNTLDLDAADKIIQHPPKQDKNGNIIQPSEEEISARKAQQQIINTGFIAQDVEASAKKINYDFDGVDAPKNNQDLYGLRYSEFVVPLVKAVQELSQQNDSLKKANLVQQNINAGLEQRIEKLETMMNISTGSPFISQQSPAVSSLIVDGK